MNAKSNEMPWKLTSPTAAFTLILVAFMLFLGLRAHLDPFGAAKAFGLPLVSPEDAGWLHTKGGRDLAIGLALLALVVTRQRLASGLFVLASVLMPVTDALTVVSHGASLGFALSVHGSAAVYCVALAATLLKRPSEATVRTPAHA